MSRPSSRLSSHRYGSSRPQSRIKRPKSAAPCLMYPETDAAMFREGWEEEEGDPALIRRPQTSFHYYPEELEVGVEVGEEVDPMLIDRDYYSNDPRCQAWGLPEDPEPLKLVKKYGYGYRKRDTELTPHWIQWPQPPAGHKAQRTVRHHVPTVAPPPAYVTKKQTTVQHSVYDPVINDLHYNANKMTSRMRYGDERNIIMHRGLSPRRAAPPVMPGRQLTQYGGAYGQRDYNILGGLDLSGPSYNPHRGYHTSRAASRESRPMHRHLRAHKQEDGYLHNNSIYYSTTPNVSGYFIIHPDWVSERLSMRRSQSLLAF